MSIVNETVRGQPLVALTMFLCLLSGCGDAKTTPTDPHDDEQPAPASNRIDVPELVRQNLGIEFVEVERRQVAATLRLPARVELLPSAVHEHRAPMGGRVTLLVEPLQKVAIGDVLYRVDSPGWRQLQQELDQLASDLEITAVRLQAMTPLLAACEQHESSLREAHSVTTGYVADLERAQENVGGQSQKLADARVALAQLMAQIADAAEKHVETETRKSELEAQLRAQRSRRDLLLASAAAILGVTPQHLDEGARWRQVEQIDVKASLDGVVDGVVVANGSLVAAQDPVLQVVDVTRVRCHARALQSDLVRLHQDDVATIVPAAAGASTPGVKGTVQIGPVGDARARTVDVFVTPDPAALADGKSFVRPGIAVFVELTAQSDAKPELAIPKACVLPDGLDRVFFRRDPNDPDKVIRVVADLGEDDGRWVEIKSGLMDGDEVVAAGAFELVLASSGSAMKGGHFHADGTWHEDKK